MYNDNMRSDKKENRDVHKTVSIERSLADFIEKRCRPMGLSASGYIRLLIIKDKQQEESDDDN